MKKLLLLVSAILLLMVVTSLSASAQASELKNSVVEHDAQVAKEQPGPHDGGGSTTGYSFFEGVKDYKTAFKKRVLKPGSSIGYHLQHEDEVYYIIGGSGVMTLNGKTFPVKPGDAILTRPGSSHGIARDKDSELTLMIVYQKK